MSRWNLVVNEATDSALRSFLEESGDLKKGALSQFVEEAVLLRLKSINAQVQLEPVAVFEHYLAQQERAGL